MILHLLALIRAYKLQRTGLDKKKKKLRNAKDKTKKGI
jgi:hypothetical protein